MIKVHRTKLSFLVVVLSFWLVSCAPSAPPVKVDPKITLSTNKVFHKGFVQMHGTGFSPNSDVRSHLKKPSGVEFPVLPILTNEKGEFDHQIDTLLLLVGTHELWVEDSKSGMTSNKETFELELGQQPVN